MTTHDNAPPPADWMPCAGNRCGCGASANLCRCLPADELCCGSCAHQAAAETSIPYYGD